MKLHDIVNKWELNYLRTLGQLVALADLNLMCFKGKEILRGGYNLVFSKRGLLRFVKIILLIIN